MGMQNEIKTLQFVDNPPYSMFAAHITWGVVNMHVQH